MAVGYIVLAFGFSFEYQGHDGFIDECFIKDGYRKKGIGGKAMEIVEAEAATLGIRALHLEVERDNEKGNRLYVKQGYRNNNRLLLTKRLKSNDCGSTTRCIDQRPLQFLDPRTPNLYHHVNILVILRVKNLRSES